MQMGAMMFLSFLIIVLLAYFIGAIPTGYIIARLNGIRDIRQHGSGNIGATNVARTLGLPYFFLIFFLDAGKAFLFLYCIQPYISSQLMYLCAAILLLGNGYSPLLSGSGGKGVATLFGISAACSSALVVILCAVWGVILLITRTVGIASVGAAIALPVYAWLKMDLSFFIFSCFCAVWIIVRHRTNICRYWEKHCAKQ